MINCPKPVDFRSSVLSSRRASREKDPKDQSIGKIDKPKKDPALKDAYIIVNEPLSKLPESLSLINMPKLPSPYTITGADPSLVKSICEPELEPDMIIVEAMRSSIFDNGEEMIVNDSFSSEGTPEILLVPENELSQTSPGDRSLIS
jgi:hypothetical protein